MKRYLLIGGWEDEITSQEEITKDDLIALKNRRSDYIIDTKEGKYFDAKANEWKEIK